MTNVKSPGGMSIGLFVGMLMVQAGVWAGSNLVQGMTWAEAFTPRKTIFLVASLGTVVVAWFSRAPKIGGDK